MKSKIATVVAVFGAMAGAAGCGADNSTRVPAADDLRGAWTQSGVGYEQGQRVTWDNQKVVIEAVDGQSFTGFKEYTREGEATQKEIINGVIGFDGDIMMTDEDGFFEGRLIDGKVKGHYAEVGDDAAAIIVELSKQ